MHDDIWRNPEKLADILVSEPQLIVRLDNGILTVDIDLLESFHKLFGGIRIVLVKKNDEIIFSHEIQNK